MGKSSMRKSGFVMAALGLFAVLSTAGCAWQLNEIKGKTKFGPEFRDRPGRKSEVRWTGIDQEFEFKWDNGYSTIVGYRRRDTDEGSGGNDNRITFGFSYPIWKRPQHGSVGARRLDRLELRLAKLEEENAGLRAGHERMSMRNADPQEHHESD